MQFGVTAKLTSLTSYSTSESQSVGPKMVYPKPCKQQREPPQPFSSRLCELSCASSGPLMVTICMSSRQLGCSSDATCCGCNGKAIDLVSNMSKVTPKASTFLHARVRRQMYIGSGKGNRSNHLQNTHRLDSLSQESSCCTFSGPSFIGTLEEPT